jgi:exodeoxyribonuclease V alpha subunit
MNDIQVLTPTRKGNLGVERLNPVLQNYLNPQANNKVEKNLNGVIFREGDKVMQIKNNYKIPWEIRGKRGIVVDEGMGVFNGDVGIIDNINLFSNELTVRFEDDKFVVYSFKEVDELEHAYAVTVHKSQGSEYPAVVLPILTGPKLLFNRNLLYTAITRAKECVTIVGDREKVLKMIENISEYERYTSLDIALKQIGGIYESDR